MDSSIEKLNLLHPNIRQQALDAYAEAVRETPEGVHPIVDQTERTFAESDALYAQGRTTGGEIVTQAKAGQSYHNYALALDFHLIVNDKDVWDVDHNWMIVVNIFKKHGFSWGGDFPGTFKDYPHLENRLGYNWRQLQVMYTSKKFIEGTNFLNI